MHLRTPTNINVLPEELSEEDQQLKSELETLVQCMDVSKS